MIPTLVPKMFNLNRPLIVQWKQNTLLCVCRAFINVSATASSSQTESNAYSVRLAEQSEHLQKAEELSAIKGQQVEELQRLLGSMAIERDILKDKMEAEQAEVLQLKADSEEREEDEKR